MEYITSLDLYLRCEAGRVVETECLEDVGAGIYPCYYMKSGDRLKVCTSVSSLVQDSGRLVLNTEFSPPDFLGEYFWKRKLGVRILRRLHRHLGYPRIKETNPWYSTSESIDRRVRKLKAFEKVSPSGSTTRFRPDASIRSHEIIVGKTVEHMRTFVNKIEDEFPDHHHVVLTGGKDSQLILLVPKRDPDRWHLFSAEPNYSVVTRWVEKNGVHVNRVFRHDNKNEESADDLRNKIICGDLYSDPSHIRWMPTMKKIATEFGSKCLFWGGTMSSPAHFYDGSHLEDFGDNRKAFFDSHFTRTAAWQGNYHQVFKNFTGSPYLSPYHSPEIWTELYQRIDPTAIARGTDLRLPIGDRLFGKPVYWIHENPAPKIYSYGMYINAYKTYLNQLRKAH